MNSENPTHVRLEYGASIDNFESCNPSFDRGVMRICYTGKNRNGSIITREAMERCLPSIYNCPVVCRYDRETGQIGAHDVDFVNGEDGGMKIVHATSPVGLIPESAHTWFADYEEEDGTIHEYLYADVLLWKRQEAYNHIKENGITSQSMEIDVLDGGFSDGGYEIKDFCFTAFCLLETAKPCFESAGLVTFELEEFQEQLNVMLAEAKQFLSVPPSNEVSIDKNTEGGNAVLKKEKLALMAEFGLNAEDVDFSIEDFDLEELREKFAQLTEARTHDSDNPAPEQFENNEAENEQNNTVPEEQFALMENFKDELNKALSEEKVTREWGEDFRYWYVNCDTEISEVYFIDTEESYTLFGAPYTTSGDLVSIDFTRKMRKKYAIVDFDEGEQINPVDPISKLVTEHYSREETAWAEKYQILETSFNQKAAEFEAYRASIENAAADAEKRFVYESFARTLSGVEAYELLGTELSSYTKESIEEKCFAIIGRMKQEKFSIQEPKATKLPVGEMAHGDSISKKPYGGLVEEFGYAND